MPTPLQLREGIKTRLVAAGVLAADRIVVERQTDVLARVATIVARTGAVACTIAAAEGEQLDAASKSLIQQVTVRLSLWTRTVLSLEETPEETVFLAVVRALHHYAVPGVHDVYAASFRQRLEVVRWGEVDDPEYLRREVTVRTMLVMDA